MDFLNKPMSEVWKATKRTFNDILEINNTDLNEATGSQHTEFAIGTSRTTNTRTQHLNVQTSINSTERRYTYGASLPRLKKPPQPVDFGEYHVLETSVNIENFQNVDSSTSRDGHTSRSRTVTPTEDEYHPRSRYRSNSSDRASVRIRKDVDTGNSMVNRYNRSTSYDKAMENTADEEEDEEEEDTADKMKTKLMAVWNNMKYGWTVKSKTAFSLQKPIWFLGTCYQHRPSDPEPVSHPGMESVKSPQMELFKQDFTSRLWMTYRREFPQIEGTTITTDCGWGCMLRSGQMILAQCLVTHFLGREWNIYKEQSEEQSKFHHEIIRWFGDQPSDMSPFSVHRLVNLGLKTGKKAGDWYGPASVAHIMRDAMETAPELNPLFEQVTIYVAQDCTVYKQDVIDLCRNRYQGSPKPTYKDEQSSPKPTNKDKGNSPQVTNEDKNTSAHAQTNSLNAPNQKTTSPTTNVPVNSHNALQQNRKPDSTKMYGRETAINGNCRVDEKPQRAGSTLRNHSYYASVTEGEIEPELIVSHNSSSKKQTKSSDRTINHSTFGNSNSTERLCASNGESDCQSNCTISHNATQFSKCPPIPPHGTSQASQNAPESANCPPPPIPPHGPGFGHGKPTHNAAGLASPPHNASGHIYSPVAPDLPGYGHGTPTHNATEHTAVKSSKSIPGHQNSQASHNPTVYSKSLPSNRNSGHVLETNSQGCKRRTKSQTNNSDVCQIQNDTGDVCRVRENSEHFIYRRNAVRENTDNSKPPTRDNRTWREYRNPSGGQRSQSESDDSATSPTHEPIWRRKSENLQSTTLASDISNQSRVQKTQDLLPPPLITRKSQAYRSQEKLQAALVSGTRTQNSTDSQSRMYVKSNAPRKNSNEKSSPVFINMQLNKRKVSPTQPLVLTQNSKETEISGVCVDSDSNHNEKEPVSVARKISSSSSDGTRHYDTPSELPSYNALSFSATHTSGPSALPRHNANGQAHNIAGQSVTHNSAGQSLTHNASEQSLTRDESSEQSDQHKVENKDNNNSGTETETEKKWCALILLVPVRLGGDEVNPIYVNPLRSLFTLESCMGIIGGKPKHSLYYVGFQDEKLIHLDPHYCQAVVDMKNRKFPTFSFHCMSPRKMRITNMDPSCTVGFYLKTEQDFEEFCQMIPEVVTPAQSSGDYPMFIVRDGSINDWQDNASTCSDGSDTKKDRFLRIRHIDQDGRLIAPLKESEDFVFLS